MTKSYIRTICKGITDKRSKLEAEKKELIESFTKSSSENTVSRMNAIVNLETEIKATRETLLKLIDGLEADGILKEAEAKAFMEQLED